MTLTRTYQFLMYTHAISCQCRLPSKGISGNWLYKKRKKLAGKNQLFYAVLPNIACNHFLCVNIFSCLSEEIFAFKRVVFSLLHFMQFQGKKMQVFKAFSDLKQHQINILSCLINLLLNASNFVLNNKKMVLLKKTSFLKKYGWILVKILNDIKVPSPTFWRRNPEIPI